MTDSDPITLNEACAVFRGTLTPATLRAEHKRGRLAIFKIGRRYYTSRYEVELMVRRCRDEAKAPGSISTKSGEPGPSETERVQSQRACLITLSASYSSAFTLVRDPASFSEYVGIKST